MFGWLKRGKRQSEPKSPGSQAIQEVAETWMVDAGQVRWVHGGFDWWPGSFRVEVRCFEDSQSGANDRWRLSVATGFVDGVDAADPNVAKFAALFGRFSPASLVFTPVVGRRRPGREGPSDLYLFSSVYVAPELLGWLPTFLARMALMQPVNAEIQAEFQAETLGGRPSFGPNGKVSELDGVLDVVSNIYAPAGTGRSWWHDTREFEDVAKLLSAQGFTAAAKPDRLIVAAVFGAEPMMIALLSDARHPQLGSGLLVTVELPFHFPEGEAFERAGLLNFEEATSWTGFPQLGCWHRHDREGGASVIVHSTFVPNALAQPNLATHFAFWSLDRAQWAYAIAERWTSPTLQ